MTKRENEHTEATLSGRRPISLATVAGVLLRYAPLMFVVAAIGFGVAYADASKRAATYTALVSFVPLGSKAAGPAGGLAAQLGFGSIATDASSTPEFYIELVQSRAILGRVAAAQYSMTTRGREVRGNLAEVLQPGSGASRSGLDAAIRYLRGAINPSFSPRAGLVRIAVTTHDPNLSAQIGARAVEALDAFNRESARVRAAQQRDFTQQALFDVREELRAAEARLQGHLQRNRDVSASSAASLETERLSREVSLRQQLYTSVAQAFAQASMEESRNAPQISIIDKAEPPLHPNVADARAAGALGALLGVLAVVALVLLREAVRLMRSRNVQWYTDVMSGLKHG